MSRRAYFPPPAPRPAPWLPGFLCLHGCCLRRVLPALTTRVKTVSLPHRARSQQAGVRSLLRAASPGVWLHEARPRRHRLRCPPRGRHHGTLSAICLHADARATKRYRELRTFVRWGSISWCGGSCSTKSAAHRLRIGSDLAGTVVPPGMQGKRVNARVVTCVSRVALASLSRAVASPTRRTGKGSDMDRSRRAVTYDCCVVPFSLVSVGSRCVVLPRTENYSIKH